MTQEQTKNRARAPSFTVHDRCRKARDEATLDIEELAERIGVHRRGQPRRLGLRREETAPTRR